MEAMHGRLRQFELRVEQLQRELQERVEQVHRSYRRDLVPYEPPGQMVRRADAQRRGFTIRIDTTSEKADGT
jgi:hypothetical protein